MGLVRDGGLGLVRASLGLVRASGLELVRKEVALVMGVDKQLAVAGNERRQATRCESFHNNLARQILCEGGGG